jgi:hypothetical protein
LYPSSLLQLQEERERQELEQLAPLPQLWRRQALQQAYGEEKELNEKKKICLMN